MAKRTEKDVETGEGVSGPVVNGTVDHGDTEWVSPSVLAARSGNTVIHVIGE